MIRICVPAEKDKDRNFIYEWYRFRGSADVILGQEVGLLPVNNIQGRFFLRMDIKLIEGHHVLVLEVRERS